MGNTRAHVAREEARHIHEFAVQGAAAKKVCTSGGASLPNHRQHPRAGHIESLVMVFIKSASVARCIPN